MINVTDKSRCCGCTACVSSCPLEGDKISLAINMKNDEEGFFYPSVDMSRCVDCGLCERSCFYVTGTSVKDDVLDIQKSFIACNHDQKIREISQSGGMFGAIAEYALRRNGVVYGAAMNEDFSVSHHRITSEEEMESLHGSKYVQSNMVGVFKQVKADLLSDKYVVFSGTACQIMGLRKYLRNESFDKLVLVDIICFGVPSPLVWKEFLVYMKKTLNSSIQTVKFRDKKYGWHTCRSSILVDGKVEPTDLWTRIFNSRLALRPSCYECKFTNLKRPSDITIGDAWGLDKNNPNLDDNKGMSLVLINSKQGAVVFNDIVENLNIWEIDINDYRQNRLQRSAEKPDNRAEFWQCFNRQEFSILLERFAGNTRMNRIKSALKSVGIVAHWRRQIKKFFS